MLTEGQIQNTALDGVKYFAFCFVFLFFFVLDAIFIYRFYFQNNLSGVLSERQMSKSGSCLVCILARLLSKSFAKVINRRQNLLLAMKELKVNYLNICILVIPKCLLWQTVKIPMKCQHFTRVCTVCFKQKHLQRKIFFLF